MGLFAGVWLRKWGWRGFCVWGGAGGVVFFEAEDGIRDSFR